MSCTGGVNRKAGCSWDEPEELALEENREQRTWSPSGCGLWLSRGCPPELRAGTQSQFREGRPEKDVLWDPQEVWEMGKEG